MVYGILSGFEVGSTSVSEYTKRFPAQLPGQSTCEKVRLTRRQAWLALSERKKKRGEKTGNTSEKKLIRTEMVSVTLVTAVLRLNCRVP